MGIFNLQEIWFLNPDYDIRSDADRYLLFSKVFRHYDSEAVQSFIHPVHAWILSLFSGGCEIQTAYKMISSELSITEEEIAELIGSWFGNEQSFYIEIEGAQVLMPRNILIPKRTINNNYDIKRITIEKPITVKSVDLLTRRHQIPFLLTLMLNNKCLTKCCYCYADTNTLVEHKLELDRIIEIIRQAKEIGVNNFQLIGGEVFLHPKWWIILKELLNNGFCPEIISTKIPINIEILEHLKNIDYPGLLQLSIDSFDEVIATKTLKCYSGYIDDIVRGLTLLENENIPYRVETVLTKSTASINNIDTIYDHLKESNSIVAWDIREAMFSNYKNNNIFSEIKATTEQLQKVFTHIENNINRNARFSITLSRTETSKRFYEAEDGCLSFSRAYCSALNHHMFILPDGKCTICEQLYWNPSFIIGDLSYENILDVWNSPKSTELLNIQQNKLNQKSACHNCTLFDECFRIYRNRCWSDIIKAYGANNWDFPDPLCRFAPMVINNVRY